MSSGFLMWSLFMTTTMPAVLSTLSVTARSRLWLTKSASTNRVMRETPHRNVSTLDNAGSAECADPAAGEGPFDLFFNLALGNHGRIARRFLNADAVRGPPLDGHRSVLPLHERGRYARDERVATAGAVGNLDILPDRGVVYAVGAHVVKHCAPGDPVGCDRAAELGSDQFQVLVVARDLPEQLRVDRKPFFERRILGNFFGDVSERVVEVALVADQEIDVPNNPFVDRAGALL